jgi:hypothetical protein
MNCPAIAAIWLTPSARPRCSAGNASVRIAAEFAVNIEPPMAWTPRQPISHSAPLAARNGSKLSSTDARPKTAYPAL